MAAKIQASAVESGQLETLVNALMAVAESTKTECADLQKISEYFLADTCPVQGKDADSIVDSYRTMKNDIDRAIAQLDAIKNVVSAKAEQLNLAMNWANKTTQQAAEDLKASASAIADAHRA